MDLRDGQKQLEERGWLRNEANDGYVLPITATLSITDSRLAQMESVNDLKETVEKGFKNLETQLQGTISHNRAQWMDS